MISMAEDEADLKILAALMRRVEAGVREVKTTLHDHESRLSVIERMCEERHKRLDAALSAIGTDNLEDLFTFKQSLDDRFAMYKWVIGFIILGMFAIAGYVAKLPNVVPGAP